MKNKEKVCLVVHQRTMKPTLLSPYRNHPRFKCIAACNPLSPPCLSYLSLLTLSNKAEMPKNYLEKKETNKEKTHRQFFIFSIIQHIFTSSSMYKVCQLCKLTKN